MTPTQLVRVPSGRNGGAHFVEILPPEKNGSLEPWQAACAPLRKPAKARSQPRQKAWGTDSEAANSTTVLDPGLWKADTIPSDFPVP